MIDCKNCLHSGLCMHEDKVEEYIRQHESMRDKCSLFDGEPTCNRFIDNKVLYKEVPKVVYNDKCEDERTITKDYDLEDIYKRISTDEFLKESEQIGRILRKLYT